MNADELTLLYFFLGGIVALWVVCIICWMVSSTVRKRRAAAKAALITTQFKRLVEAAVRAGSLRAVATSAVILKPGELAYWVEPSALYETRSVRHSTGGGAGVRVAKGVTVYRGAGTSHYTQQWQKVADGTLVVTNMRILFNGDSADRTVKLEKVMAVDGRLEELEVSSETRQKSMVFTSGNGLYVEWLVKQIIDASRASGA